MTFHQYQRDRGSAVLFADQTWAAVSSSTTRLEPGRRSDSASFRFPFLLLKVRHGSGLDGLPRAVDRKRGGSQSLRIVHTAVSTRSQTESAPSSRPPHSPGDALGTDLEPNRPHGLPLLVGRDLDVALRRRQRRVPGALLDDPRMDTPARQFGHKPPAA